MRSEVSGRPKTHFAARLTRNQIASPIVQLKKQNNPIAQTSKHFLILPSARALITIAGNVAHDPTEMGHDEGGSDPSAFNFLDHSIAIVQIDRATPTVHTKSAVRDIIPRQVVASDVFSLLVHLRHARMTLGIGSKNPA